MEEQGSSSGASSKASNLNEQKILLHILSPSFGVPNRLTFQDVSTSTTIGELKKKIHDAVPSKPSPQWQRLIYRGRALVQDGITLKDIFTQDMINQSEALSLHLVLPPAGPEQTTALSSPSAVLATAPATAPDRSDNTYVMQSRRAVGEQPVNNQGNINTTGPESGLPVQDGQTHTNLTNLHPQHVPPNQIPSQLPPFMQQAMRDYYDALVHQSGGQLPTNGNPVAARSLPPPQNSAPRRDASTLRRLMAQQQQLRVSPGPHGVNQGEDDRHSQIGTPSQVLNHGSAATINTPFGSLPPNSRIVQENRGPNGEHWRMVIESTQTITHPPHHQPHHHHHHHHHTQNNQNQRSNPTISTSNDHNAQSSLHSGTSTPQSRGSPRMPSGFQFNETPRNGQSQQSLLEQNLSSIETALAEGTAPHEPHFHAARTFLQRMVASGEIPGDVETALRARIDHLSTQADQLRASLNSILMRVISEQPPAQRSTPSTPPPPPPIVPSPSNTVYILSSPSGPHALLVSPSGMYTTSSQFSTPANVTPNSTPHQTTNAATPTQATNLTEVNTAQPPENPPQEAPVQRQQQHEQQLNQQINQARDLVRLLLPLGGHLWLLVRLFGFVYFFTGGGGHRRAILLGLGAFLVFIAQTGLFRPFLQSVWEPVRRHIENILPLATNDRPLLVGPAAGNNANAAAEPQAQRGNEMPTPQQAAERLLRERETRDGSIIRQNLRRLERAVALFVASLVPGVGERHIAARDAAEAARQEEERLRREEEERVREANAVENDVAQGNDGAQLASSPAPENADDRPAVEV